MNSQLSGFARQTLKDGLQKCTQEQQLLFKRMYSHKNLDKDINDVVDQIPNEKLDWAMQQIQRTLDKTGGWMGGIGAEKTENEEKLRAFALEIMSHWPENGIDGDDLQEIAVKHGLLKSTTKYLPCNNDGYFCSGYNN